MVVQAYTVCIGVTPECRQTESEMIRDGQGCVDEADEVYHDNLLLKPGHGKPQYLNADTFQEEVLEHPGDHFQDPNLWDDVAGLRIWLSGGREDPLFLALPSH